MIRAFPKGGVAVDANGTEAWSAQRALIIVCLAIAAQSISPAPARAATAAEVNQAVDKAKEYLYSKQNNGNYGFPTGWAASLCCCWPSAAEP